MISDPSTTDDPLQLQRDLSQKTVAGVASGTAAHLKSPVVWSRTAFMLLALLGGVGAFLYGVLWALVSAGKHEEAPGLADATRASMRSQRVGGRIDAGMLFSAGALIVGVLWGMVPDDDTDTGRGVSLFWPLLLAGVGVVLVWFQADGSGLRTRSPEKRPGSRARTIANVAQLVGGLILVGFGTSWLLASQFGWEGLQTTVTAAIASLAGVAVVTAPWLLRLWSRVRTTGRERLHVETRVDMAAHLHDSMSRTLALIQRQTDGPVLVASLTCRQERELCAWLYREETRAQTLRGALEQMRIGVEERFPIAVETIYMSDIDLDEASTALVQATGETVANAAEHSGVSRVNAFAEVEPEQVGVFVRGRNCGSDEVEIHPDRRGVKESIKTRMERYRGTARTRTAPGEDAEVRLELS